MDLYRSGYVVSEIRDNDYTYNVWPLADAAEDAAAVRLTDEADRNWFLKYNMQHIIPDYSFVKKYYSYCREAGLRVCILLYETPHSEVVVRDMHLSTITVGFDCIGNVYYSYLKNEYACYKGDLNARGIYRNRYGLLDTLEDILTYINLRQEDIHSGISLEDFWKEMPVRISCIQCP